MTIVCTAQFAEACAFAASVDAAYAAAIDTSGGESDGALRGMYCGKASSSLLRCIGSLSRCDAEYNRDSNYLAKFPAGTVIAYDDGRSFTVSQTTLVDDLPAKETFLYSETVEHSFFFVEGWISRRTRQPVTVTDNLSFWFCPEQVKRIGLDRIRVMPYDELYRLALSGECRLLVKGEDIPSDRSHGFVRRVQRMRRGVCGGIIFHRDYVDGKQTNHGSWSIHT